MRKTNGAITFELSYDEVSMLDDLVRGVDVLPVCGVYLFQVRDDLDLKLPVAVFGLVAYG